MKAKTKGSLLYFLLQDRVMSYLLCCESKSVSTAWFTATFCLDFSAIKSKDLDKSL